MYITAVSPMTSTVPQFMDAKEINNTNYCIYYLMNYFKYISDTQMVLSQCISKMNGI